MSLLSNVLMKEYTQYFILRHVPLYSVVVIYLFIFVEGEGILNVIILEEVWEDLL